MCISMYTNPSFQTITDIIYDSADGANSKKAIQSLVNLWTPIYDFTTQWTVFCLMLPSNSGCISCNRAFCVRKR